MATPFPITIGNERMTVTAMVVDSTQSNTSTSTHYVWTVTPGAGGTTSADHAVNAPVMSNPLPLGANNKQMQMCIAEESWSNVPSGPDFDYANATDCTYDKLPDSYKNPDPTTGQPGVNYGQPLQCAMFTTTVYDIGDGFMNR